LLILRALRKQFPKAIFFTTDLDAALLHPDQFQWTRNMLVASSFDLKIASYSVIRRMKKAAATDAAKKYLQMLLDLTEITIPQNRDVYQTSVFLSTIWAVNPTPSLGLKDNIEMEIRSVEKKEDKLINRAINNLKKDVGNDNAPKTLDDLLKKMFGKYLIVIEETIQNAIQKGFHQSFGQYIKPRVYEIGRRGAVDLTALDNKNEGIDQLNPFYPLPMSSISLRAIVMIASSAIMFGLLSFLFWRRWIIVSGINTNQIFRASMRCEDYKAVGAAFVAVAILLMCYFLSGLEKNMVYCILTDYLLIAAVYVYLIRRIMKARGEYVRSGEAA